MSKEKGNATSVTGGQALVEQLKREGVTDIFGIPGVQLDWAIDALCDATEDIKFYVPRHEQATSYMADGYARTTGREGVCIMVPGPGMLNALAGLSTAYACNSRVLFISGQIPSNMIGKGRGLLHEIPDQSGILKSLSKWHGLASDPSEVSKLVHEAFIQLRSGHPRPVTLEIPPDVLQAVCETSFFDAAPFMPTLPEKTSVDAAVDLLTKAKFPVIYSGGGVVAANGSDALQDVCEKLGAPVVVTENGRGAMRSSHPLALTTLGGRAVLPHADVVLVVGTRFMDVLGEPTMQRSNCKYIYVNIEPTHLTEPRVNGVQILGDANSTLLEISNGLSSHTRKIDRTEDMQKIKEWARIQTDQILPQADFAKALRASLKSTDILVSELTQVGYYSSVAYEVEEPRTYISPGYQGTLGYGFSTALGVAAGNPDKQVVSISGDGGFGWGLQDLATAAKYNLNLTIIVFADEKFGNVQRIQRRTFGREFAVELYNPDYALLAASFGITHYKVETPNGLQEAMDEAAKVQGPAFIEVPVGEMASPWPIILPFVPPEKAPPPNPLGEPTSV